MNCTSRSTFLQPTKRVRAPTHELQGIDTHVSGSYTPCWLMLWKCDTTKQDNVAEKSIHLPDGETSVLIDLWEAEPVLWETGHSCWIDQNLWFVPRQTDTDVDGSHLTESKCKNSGNHSTEGKCRNFVPSPPPTPPTVEPACIHVC